MAQGTAGFTSLALDEAKWPTTPAKETRNTSERREKNKCFIVFFTIFHHHPMPKLRSMENKRHETTNQKCPSLPSMDSSQYQPTPELINKTPWKAQPCPALRQCQAEDIHDKQEKNSCPHHLLQRVCYPDGRETMRFTRFAYFPCR